MTDLQACYFCGAADGVEIYAAVPDALDPDETVQRSVPLCGTCGEKLATVLDPVVAAATAAEGSAGDAADAAGSGGVGTGSVGEGDDSAEGGDSVGDDDPRDVRDPIDAAESPPESGSESVPDAETVPGGAGATERRSEAGPARPPAYDKVMRLLRNREFPMERTAVEALATSAYDLAEAEAREIVDAAVANGEFAEDGDLLRRPE